MGELIKNFLIYGVGGILTKLVGFFLLPIFTSQLLPEEYGYYDLILSISAIIGAISIMQYDAGFQKFYYTQESEKERNVLISTILFIILLLSTFAAVIFIILAPAVSSLWFKGGYVLALRLAGGEVIVSNLMMYLLCVLRYENRPKQYAVIAVSSALLNASLCILFVVYFHLGVTGALLGSLLSQTIICLIILYIERRRLEIVFDIPILKTVSKFAFPMVPARIGSVANSYANRFFMISMFTAEMIGLYSLALKLASAIGLIQTAFQLAWLPYLYKILNQEGHKKIIIDVFRQSVFAICLIVILISLFAKEIVELVSNSGYIEAYTIVGFLCLYNGLFIVKDTAEIGVKVTGKSIYVTYAYFISVAINFLFLFILPRYLGLIGIALSLLLSNISLIYLTLYFSNRLYKINFPVSLFSLILVLTILLIFVTIKVEIPIYIKILISVAVIALWGLYNKNTLLRLHNSMIHKVKHA